MTPTDVLPLLQICDLAKQWPNLKAVHDLAMAELADAAVEAQGELDKRAEEAAKEAAAAQAKADAEKKAAADKQAAQDKKQADAQAAAAKAQPAVTE